MCKIKRIEWDKAKELLQEAKVTIKIINSLDLIHADLIEKKAENIDPILVKLKFGEDLIEDGKLSTDIKNIIGEESTFLPLGFIIDGTAEVYLKEKRHINHQTIEGFINLNMLYKSDPFGVFEVCDYLSNSNYALSPQWNITSGSRSVKMIISKQAITHAKQIIRDNTYFTDDKYDTWFIFKNRLAKNGYACSAIIFPIAWIDAGKNNDIFCRNIYQWAWEQSTHLRVTLPDKIIKRASSGYVGSAMLPELKYFYDLCHGYVAGYVPVKNQKGICVDYTEIISFLVDNKIINNHPLILEPTIVNNVVEQNNNEYIYMPLQNSLFMREITPKNWSEHSVSIHGLLSEFSKDLKKMFNIEKIIFYDKKNHDEKSQTENVIGKNINSIKYASDFDISCFLKQNELSNHEIRQNVTLLHPVFVKIKLANTSTP
jgi:hypothetical protein